MNNFVKRFAMAVPAACFLVSMATSPAQSGMNLPTQGNFNSAAALDITQVVNGGSNADYSTLYVCFPVSNSFDCISANDITHRDFIGFREGEPLLVNVGEED